MKSEEEPWKPFPIEARTSEDILRSSGSIYVHSMTMETLMRAIKRGSRLKAFLESKSISLSTVREMKIRKGKFSVVANSEHIFPLDDLDMMKKRFETGKGL